jgi:hypothetical protein
LGRDCFESDAIRRLAQRGIGLARHSFPAIKQLKMSTSEIPAQLPRLTPEEREAVRARLDDIDAAAPLSSEGKRIIDERVAAYRQNPGDGVSWAVTEADMRKQLSL